MITLKATKFLKNLPAFWAKISERLLEIKLLEFSANIKDHNFGMKTLINFK